jgi:HK97 gp10 family phage protein
MVTKIRITRVYDDRLVEQIEPAMRNLGQAVGARMQRLVPKRTWALHDTISTSTERNGSKITTTIGFGSADVDYGLHVERGTSRTRAQPFARPALLQSRAGDLKYKGRGIVNHGEQKEAQRQRRRDRAADRRTAAEENRNES